MFWYFIIFAALLVLALLEGAAQSRWPGYACAFIMMLMAGLRYETGFDWADYEQHFLLTPPFGETDLYASVTRIMVEPGYELLARALRTLGVDFQAVIFICGTFSIWALSRLTARFSPLIGVVLVWYYGFLFLPGPLAMMRQTLSVSFIYLALIAANDRRLAKAVILSGIGLSIHYFSAIFLPVVFWRGVRPGLHATIVTAICGFAISTIGNNLFVFITDTVVAATGGGFIADKMSTYSSFVGAEISPLSLVLVLYHIAFMWLVERRKAEQDYIVGAAMLAAFTSVLLHSLFAPLPILWNRMMLISLPLEIIALCRLYRNELSRDIIRNLAIGVASLGSSLALLYTFSNEQSLVYRPYQSLAVVWFRGPYGDGRARYYYILGINDRIFQEKRVR